MSRIMTYHDSQKEFLIVSSKAITFPCILCKCPTGHIQTWSLQNEGCRLQAADCRPEVKLSANSNLDVIHAGIQADRSYGPHLIRLHSAPVLISHWTGLFERY